MSDHPAGARPLTSAVGPARRRRNVRQMPFAGEARAVPELAAFMMTAGPLLAAAPRGDRHRVIVLPGLGGGDVSTRPLRWFLDRLGYRTSGWGLGTNRGFGRQVSRGLDELLHRTALDGPVSLVGWSLGGVHAVDMARARPDLVRGVTTLGSPLSGRRLPPPGVPFTSVYSRTDGIVPWRDSDVSTTPDHQSIEVTGSHLGLGHNPAVLIVVADRLAQPREAWRPFSPPRWARRWIPAPAPIV